MSTMSNIPQELPEYFVKATGDGSDIVERLRSFLSENETRDLNNAQFDGWTILALSSFYGYTAVARLLVEEFNADPNQCDELGSTPLMYAAYGDKHETVTYLVGLPDIDVNRRNPKESNMTALDYARVNNATTSLGILSLAETLRSRRSPSLSEAISAEDDVQQLLGQLAASRAENERLAAKIKSQQEEITQRTLSNEELLETNDTCTKRLAEQEELIDQLRTTGVEAKAEEEDTPPFEDWFWTSVSLEIDDSVKSVWQTYLNKMIETGLDDIEFWKQLVLYNGTEKRFHVRWVLKNVVCVANRRDANLFVRCLIKLVGGDYSTMSLSDWLDGRVGLRFYKHDFVSNGFEDVSEVMDGMDEEILEGMGMKCVGHRLRILFDLNLLQKVSRKCGVVAQR